jgi:putative DNA modification/repair radical SAM protein
VDVSEKLGVLADAAKYDVSCSSSGSNRKNAKGGIGNASTSGICHSYSADGRCISLLKILLTNYCIYDCAYCVNRLTNDIPRAAFTPDEVVDLTINFYRRNYIEGLFLSSAVFKSPNYTMELLIKVVKNLRTEHRFNGYIHLKAIPGADEALIKEAGLFADRMSVNIELPSSAGLKLLAPQKKKESILQPMSLINNEINIHQHDKRIYKASPSFVPGGQSTQLIIGATPDNDLKIIRLSEGLYNKYKLKRVYYSAYVPVSTSPKLPSLINPPLLREHRLYQADWLLRFYGFSAEELLNEKSPDFDTSFDPKTYWALNNIGRFPVEINFAPYETLLRVPGIGVRSAQKILTARKVHSLNYDNLRKLGIVLKRAQYFITCSGKYYGDVKFNDELIRGRLRDNPGTMHQISPTFEQLSFITNVPSVYVPQDIASKIHGEF